MALSLKIPAITDKPLIIAETRTSKISEFLERLPVDNLLSAATTLFDELEILNRQKVSSDDRLRALETYRPAVIRLSEALCQHYCLAPLPLPESAKSYASAAELLWLELSYGYKLAILDKQKKLFNLGGEKSSALILQRALEALRELAMVYHQTYFALPAGIWSDLHQLYLYALQHELQDISVAVDEAHDTTISRTYKQSVLMALADPQHLSSIDIKRVEDYIRRHASYAHIQGIALIENPAGIFHISLNTDQAPVPYRVSKKVGDPKHDVYFITVDLARLLHKHIQQLKSHDYEHTSDLPADAKDPRYLDLLTYLIRQWSDAHKRVFDRSRNHQTVDIAIGISAAHHFFSGEKPASPGIEVKESTANEAIITSERSVIASRWIVLNLSAGGIGLRKPPNVRDNLRIGSLLCIRESSAKHWSLGVVRWAANNEIHQIDLGTQLIAPSARPAGLRSNSQEPFDQALVLPGITVLKQQASIIAPSGMYQDGGQLELQDYGRIHRIRVEKLLERTNSFEQFSFSYL